MLFIFLLKTMSYTETNTTSYFSRLSNSFKWIFVWLLLIVWSVWLLWWNEWRTIDVSTWLNEAEEKAIEWKLDIVDPNLDNKIVFNAWEIDVKKPLKDNTFWFTWNFVKIYRIVEKYQWKENVSTRTEENLWWSKTTTKTYTYKKVWSDKDISSDKFKEWWHINSKSWKYNSRTFLSTDVYLWKLRLSEPFVQMIDKKNIFNLSERNLKIAQETTKNNDLKLYNNYFFHWKWTPENPEIWDLRIHFEVVKPTIVSVIWLQKWNTIYPYTTKRDTEVALLEYWMKTKEQMFKNAQDNNKLVAWILRFIGLLLMYLWFKMIFDFIVVVAKVVPFIWTIVDFWTWIVSLILTLIIGWGVIIIAWFYVRPLLSISLIVLISIIVRFLVYKNKLNNMTKKMNN